MECNDVIKKYKESCENLAKQINKYLFDGSRNFYWVAQEVGGICDFEDSDFLTPSEMILILENNITYDEYAEWRDSNAYNKPYINLPSWIKGCRHEILTNGIFNKNSKDYFCKLKSNKKFVDFTNIDALYICENKLNISNIEEGDLVKFEVFTKYIFDGNHQNYGFIKYIKNVNNTTFMICSHFDKGGKEIMIDYAYSSHYKAFVRLNHSNSFYDWCENSTECTAYTPKWFVKYWKQLNNIKEEDAEDVIEEKDVMCNDFKNESDFKAKVFDKLKEVNDSFDKMGKKIDTNLKDVIKLKEQITELSNRINIVSKSTINEQALEQITKKSKYKPKIDK